MTGQAPRTWPPAPDAGGKQLAPNFANINRNQPQDIPFHFW